MGGNLFVDDGVDEVSFFCGLNCPYFFLFIKIDRILHQLIQQFNLLLKCNQIFKYFEYQSLLYRIIYYRCFLKLLIFVTINDDAIDFILSHGF